MDHAQQLLANLNFFEVGLTALFSMLFTLWSQASSFKKLENESQQSKQEIIQELRGQISSIKDLK